MKRVYCLFLVLILCSSVVLAQGNQAVYSKKGLANEGYDVVAYFLQNKAEKGKTSLVVSYKGARYLFDNPDNKAAFIKSPEKYLPQYGGWCAYAMGANGEKVEVDPKTFKVTNGKLYLFYNAYFNNTLVPWNKDEKNLMTKADKNWAKLTN